MGQGIRGLVTSTILTQNETGCQQTLTWLTF